MGGAAPPVAGDASALTGGGSIDIGLPNAMESSASDAFSLAV